MSYRQLRAHALVSALCTAGLCGQSDSAEIEDAVATDAALTYSDAIRFKTWTTGADLFFEVVMHEPIVAGMFTCLHIYLDADNKPDTGIGGAELWLRASVGSRYHPNSYRPKNPRDGKPALDLRRASLSRIQRTGSGSGRDGMTWLHSTVLPPPEIEAKTVRFKVPTSTIRELGGRYGSVTGVMAEVETSCTDQPLMLRHLCDDEGIRIEVDGDARDWSHPRIARDEPGELHPVAQFLDLTSLRVEHDAERLYAAVELAQEGLARDELPGDDIERFDGVTIYVEPMYPRYQDPARLFIRYGRARHPVARSDRLRARYHGLASAGGGSWHGAVGDRTVEIDIPRLSGQNEFRIWAWSDLRRVDRLPNAGWLQVDWGKVK